MPSSPLANNKPVAVPGISDAEWTVMREFWARGEATSADVIETLLETQSWKPPTIQTLISRLVKKGALGFTRQGREYLYRPLVAEEDCRHEVSRSFVDRVFGGKLAPMLSCFLEREKLSAKELDELRKILEAGNQ
ncbi:MAG: BlaI/MecI/CopY family transcriptional regulator [Verrucomicrobiales bacterium]|nr:BlaI/MecI/CopY family transcriptional regulator [Verrucomicrobiales bacterium]MCP5560221.1 BlaI/MecI/CopY family transcriptional regulator [Verrucomicrobiaceae bacterium]